MPRPADQLRQSTTVKCEIKWQQSSSTRTKLESKFRRIAQQVDLRQCLSEGYNNLNRKKTTPSCSKLRIYQRESTRLYSPTIRSEISVKASTTSQDINNDIKISILLVALFVLKPFWITDCCGRSKKNILNFKVSLNTDKTNSRTFVEGFRVKDLNWQRCFFFRT